MSTVDTDGVFDALTKQQIRKYLDVVGFLRSRPNGWFSLRELDDMISAGPRIAAFPPQWLDSMYVGCRRPHAPLALRVETRERQTRVKVEGGDGSSLSSDDDDEDNKPSSSSDDDGGSKSGSSSPSPAAEAIPVTVIACTAMDDPLHRPLLPPGKISSLLNASAQRHGAVSVHIYLRYRAVEVSTPDDFVEAVSESRRTGTAQVGLSTTNIAATDVARAAVQNAAERGLVYYVYGYPNVGKKRAGGQRTRAAARAVDDEQADGDAVIGGDAGGISLEDVSLGQGRVVADFADWLAVAPVSIRHERIVDGVVMDDAAMPALFRLGDPEVKIFVTRTSRSADPEGRWFTSPLRVSFILEGTKCIAIQQQQHILEPGPHSQVIFLLQPVECGRGSIMISVTDIKSGASTSGLRTVAVEGPPIIPWTRNKPVVFYHKASDDDNLFASYGLAGILTGTQHHISAERMLTPPPHFTAVLSKVTISAADVASMDQALFTDARTQLTSLGDATPRHGATADNDVESHAAVSSDDTDDAAAACDAGRDTPRASSFAKLDNRHLLPYGIDMRHPFRATDDVGTLSSVLLRVGPGARKRQRKAAAKS